jgi:hypothetical protein
MFARRSDRSILRGAGVHGIGRHPYARTFPSGTVALTYARN